MTRSSSTVLSILCDPGTGTGGIRYKPPRVEEAEAAAKSDTDPVNTDSATQALPEGGSVVGA
jgi:hypothetical protein